MLYIAGMAPESILNPEEIRDLLQHSGPVTSIGRLWEGDATPYDFRSAAQKKDEKIQTVNQLHAQASKTVEKALVKTTGQEVTVEFSKHEMVSGADAVAQISLDKVLMVLWSNPSGGQEGCFLIDRPFFFQMYTRMLGGSRAYIKPGNLTPMDQSYLVRILKPVAESLARTWSAYGNWSFILDERAVDQDVLDGLRWSFDCFRAVFNIKGGDMEGSIVAVFPREMLNSVGSQSAEAGEADAGASGAKRDQHWTKAVWSAIADIPLPLRVDLGTLVVPLEKVLNLKMGHEFALHLPESGYPVCVGSQTAFRGSIGTLGEHRAIKILQKTEGFQGG